MKTLTNPFNVVKNTRQSYSKFYQKEFTEAKTQVKKIALFRLNEILEN